MGFFITVVWLYIRQVSIVSTVFRMDCSVRVTFGYIKRLNSVSIEFVMDSLVERLWIYRIDDEYIIG